MPKRKRTTEKLDIVQNARRVFLEATDPLPNTPILNSPSNYVGTTLGLLNSSQGARNVQFALKYHF